MREGSGQQKIMGPFLPTRKRQTAAWTRATEEYHSSVAACTGAAAMPIYATPN